MTDKPTYEELEKENKILRKKINSGINNSMFNSYFESNKAVMLEVDSETKKILNANQAAVNFYGFSKDSLLKKTINDLHTLPNSEIEKLMKKAVKKKSNFFEFKHKLADGTIKDVEVYASSFSYNNRTHMYITVLDITKRKIAETKIKKQIQEYAALNEEYSTANEELIEKNEEYATLNEEYKSQNEELRKAKEKAEENEEKFKSIFDYSPQPISISNMSGKIIEVNNKVCELSGYSKEELIGKNILNTGLYNKEDREKFLKKLENTGKVADMEMNFTNRNNSVLKTLLSANIIKIKGTPYILSMVTDITKRKKAEAEILKAKERAEESDRLKTEFINNMSHEIRTPMNGILGFSELLSSPDLTPEKQKNYIKIIRNSGKQLMRIIDDILEISKLGTKQVKAINEEICLNDLLLELFSIFDIKAKENKTPLYLKKGLSDEESIILTDSSKLTKILSNLLENALKFTNTGSIEFGYNLIQNNIELYVKDTGIGIKPEKQNVIFERFSQEDKNISKQTGGLGLGLSIAKENAELLGGTITLKSEKGKGSVFFITIPYKPVKKINTDKPKKTTMKNKKTSTILIVEDEEVNFIYIETLLEYFEKGIVVLHAINGEEAVKLCKERDDIDFILMDLKMPVMDGYEATKEIKKLRPDLPIIAQTAYSTPEEKAKAMSAGCDDFISKPISNEIFTKIINKYV